MILKTSPNSLLPEKTSFHVSYAECKQALEIKEVSARTHHKEKRISYERIRGLKIKKHQFQAPADNS